jgi:uncharacterized protein
MPETEAVAVAILAKAPIPGFAKTRLIPVLGAERAAALQAALIARTVETACSAGIGPATLWVFPDERHPAFARAQQRGVTLRCQPDGDLGARMLAALTAPHGPALVIGTDCPALTPAHLRTAAGVLRTGTDVVVFPAEDGGYVLIGARRPEPSLFAGMEWSTPGVMEETRRRLQQLKLTWEESVTLWDVDVPGDLERLRTAVLADLIP